MGYNHHFEGAEHKPSTLKLERPKSSDVSKLSSKYFVPFSKLMLFQSLSLRSDQRGIFY
jgi:hypothetical protein